MPVIANYTFQSFARNKSQFLQDFFDKSDRPFEWSVTKCAIWSV